VNGRTREQAGMPLRICELLATLDGPAYIERVSLDSPAHIRAAKKAVRKAFEYQLAGKGFSMVEILSPCPTNWGKAPGEAMDWLADNMIPYYPLGIMKEV
jgi:2-oxoglutarate ferredoxin oxidoreductase subunit beta